MANILNHLVGARGSFVVFFFGWIEERAAPRRTFPIIWLWPGAGLWVCLGFVRGRWGLLMPDKGVGTASVAAELFSSFFLF
jgi:hypothetical protein